tara:strand:+ start:8269 stop:9657 length:1389 start_codon:yes stop_codon:yes gene_type:complete
MTAIKINPMVVSVSPTSTTPITPINPTYHGGGLKKLATVVVAVVIPVAAPAIASAVGLSGAIAAAGASTTVASVAGSAIVGAGLGAVSAKVTGGDVKTGALMGAIGGGIGGYSAATKAAAAAAEPVAAGSAATPAVATDGGLSATPAVATDAALSGATVTPAVATNTLADAAVTNAVAGQTVAQGAQAVATDAATQTLGAQLMSGAKAAGSAVVSAVTNPENLASITIQAGAQLIGAALAPDPEMSPEQKELIELRKQELAVLKEKDEAAFNAQMDAAEQYLAQADQYNPVYMAFQAANKAAIDSQKKLRDLERQYALASGRELSAAERRRMQLDAARNVSSSYDQGFQQGLTAQNKTTQAGLSAIPNAASYANYTNALAGLQEEVRTSEEAALARSSMAAKNIADMFASFDTKRQTTDDEQDAITKTNEMADGITNSSGAAGLNLKNAPKKAGAGQPMYNI